MNPYPRKARLLIAAGALFAMLFGASFTHARPRPRPSAKAQKTNAGKARRSVRPRIRRTHIRRISKAARIELRRFEAKIKSDRRFAAKVKRLGTNLNAITKMANSMSFGFTLADIEGAVKASMKGKTGAATGSDISNPNEKVMGLDWSLGRLII